MAELTIEPKPNSSLFRVSNEFGPPPKPLSGDFTSVREANNAIEAFRRLHIKGNKKNAPKRQRKADS